MQELANIEGAEIVIRVPIEAIPSAACVALEYCDATITNERKVAEAMVRYLNDEAEDGTTLVHSTLDRALIQAFEQGEEGFGDEEGGEE